MSQNAIVDMGKWRLAETRALTKAHAALSVFTGAALTGDADGSATAVKRNATTFADVIALPSVTY
jgi:hypothetical protein